MDRTQFGGTPGVFPCDRQIPVVTRLRLNERASLSDVKNNYVYGSETDSKVPLTDAATLDYAMNTGKNIRTGNFRAITVCGYPALQPVPRMVTAS